MEVHQKLLKPHGIPQLQKNNEDDIN